MMILGWHVNDESGKRESAFLTFESGLKLLLTKEEGEEVELRFKFGEAQQHGATGGVKFVCPDCGGTRLECCFNGPHNCEITNIDQEGDFDYGDYNSSSNPDRFQCLSCGFVITDDDEAALWEHMEVQEWCLKNCEQGA